MENDDGFILADCVPHGRVLVQISDPEVSKLVLMVKGTNPSSLLDMFCEGARWNPEVEYSTTLNRIDENLYLVCEKHKSFDIKTRARDFLYVRAAVKRDNKFYMVERSVEHGDFPESRSVVRAWVFSRVVAFIPAENDSFLVIVRMAVNFRGLTNDEDNRDMAIRMLKGYANFRNYCDQKHCCGVDTACLFSFGRSRFREPKSSSEPTKSFQLSEIPTVSKAPCLLSYMHEYEDEPFSEPFLDLVVNHEEHLSYYLKHAYSFCRLPSAGRLHKVQTADNYFYQSGDWTINADGELVFLNQQVIDAQKDVIKFIIGQLCSNLFRGKNIMHMSLPVDIFDDRALLERSACSFGFAPVFLARAGQITDEVQQMKLVTLFVLSLPSLELRAEKPFNPILGETFQGYLGGIPIYYEQVSHHPPISAYYMKSEDFELYGNLISYAEMGVNSGVGGNSGIMHIKFPKNETHFECSLPPCELSGLIVGERRFKVINRGFVLERSKQLFSEFSFGKDKKGVYAQPQKLNYAQLAGGIFKVSPEFIGKYSNIKLKYKFEGLTPKDKFEPVSYISGSWHGTIYYDEQIYKELFEPVPYLVQYEKFQLPSYSNFREDVILKRLKNLAMSQNAK